MAPSGRPRAESLSRAASSAVHVRKNFEKHCGAEGRGDGGAARRGARREQTARMAIARVSSSPMSGARAVDARAVSRPPYQATNGE